MSTINARQPRHPHHSRTERIRQVWIKALTNLTAFSTAAETHSKVVAALFFENNFVAQQKKAKPQLGIGLQNTKTINSFL